MLKLLIRKKGDFINKKIFEMMLIFFFKPRAYRGHSAKVLDSVWIGITLSLLRFCCVKTL